MCDGGVDHFGCWALSVVEGEAANSMVELVGIGGWRGDDGG